MTATHALQRLVEELGHPDRIAPVSYTPKCSCGWEGQPQRVVVRSLDAASDAEEAARSAWADHAGATIAGTGTLEDPYDIAGTLTCLPGVQRRYAAAISSALCRRAEGWDTTREGVWENSAGQWSARRYEIDIDGGILGTSSGDGTGMTWFRICEEDQWALERRFSEVMAYRYATTSPYASVASVNDLHGTILDLAGFRLDPNGRDYRPRGGCGSRGCACPTAAERR